LPGANNNFRLSHKGSRKNNFREFAPRFASDLAATIERNRKLELRYGEDFAIEERPKMA